MSTRGAGRCPAGVTRSRSAGEAKAFLAVPVTTYRPSACFRGASDPEMRSRYPLARGTTRRPRWMTSCSDDDHPAARRLLREGVIEGTFARNPSLRRSLAGAMSACELFTPCGIYLGRRGIIPFPRDRIHRVLRKVVVGLMWWHYDLRPGLDSLRFVFEKDPSEALIRDVRPVTTLGRVGSGEVFEYRHAVDASDPCRSVWLFRFFQKTVFAACSQAVDPSAERPTALWIPEGSPGAPSPQRHAPLR